MPADQQDFGALFDRHAEAVYRYCLRRVGDWSVAEDLTSVVFLEAWRRREAACALELPWLLGIATNVVRNQRRALRRHAAALRRLPVEVRSSDFIDDLAARVDAERQLAAVLVPFHRLPVKHQDVIALCDWEGLDYRQAADALGVPVGTVRSRLSRARSALAAALADVERTPSQLTRPVREEPAA